MGGRSKPHPKNFRSAIEPSEHTDLIPSPTEQELIDAGNEQLGKQGAFTANYLFQSKPEVYKAITHYLREGMATSHICSLLKVSHNTVAAVLLREQDNFPTQAKDHFLSRTKQLARLSMERLEELLPKMCARDVAITTGILVDKMLLLAGEATVIVSHKKELPSFDDFNAMINALPSANASVVDTSPPNKLDNHPNKGVSHSTKGMDRKDRKDRPFVEQTPAPLTVSQSVPSQ